MSIARFGKHSDVYVYGMADEENNWFCYGARDYPDCYGPPEVIIEHLFKLKKMGAMIPNNVFKMESYL